MPTGKDLRKIKMETALDNGPAAVDAGAVTFGDGTNGVSGSVSAANSLVGTSAGDEIGSGGVTTLPGGNYVVLSSNWDSATALDVGAATFGDGINGVVGAVSATNSLVGTTTEDHVGSRGVTLLTNGNFLVRSDQWDNGSAVDAGAVTFGSGTSGVAGPVSESNSLVGSSTSDIVGRNGVNPLPSGNYVVLTAGWDNGAVRAVGAATFGDGINGVAGPISAANSLIGSSADDYVGRSMRVLPSGNYVISSRDWANGAERRAGAVTFGSGTTGVTGLITEDNSLVGTKAFDSVGDGILTVLTNGNFVVRSYSWSNGAARSVGAVTFGSGTTGVSGPVSAANSLVGTSAFDRVGRDSVSPLVNGNYVVVSSGWDHGGVTDVGAVTLGNGTSGVTGEVTASNSLIGTTAGDQIGSSLVALLDNGNYLVRSPLWDNGAAIDAGAVTLVDGTTGLNGPVSPANSLVGTTTGDNVSRVLQLRNGNFVVVSPFWDNGPIVDAGAATFSLGSSPLTGPITAANSLVGTTAFDQIGERQLALSDGDYVISSRFWDNGAIVNAGAVTFGSGTSGVSGPVSAANSLVGTSFNDLVGDEGIFELDNGNYVVRSPNWDSAIGSVGAVTVGSGTSGVSGPVSEFNSLVGSSIYDSLGYGGITKLPNGDFLVSSPRWDNGRVTDAGAVTLVNGTTGLSGPVTATNSLVGTTDSDQVGSAGITVLSSGNYAVRSLTWDNGAAVDAGAVSFGSGTSGVQGVITATGSTLGEAANANLQPLVVDDVNGTFYARFLDEGGGRVRVGSQADGFALPVTFTVNSTGDDGDANLGDNLCETSLPGECTLRAAIEQANASPNPISGPDVIGFDLTGPAPHSINLGGQLEITDTLAIHGPGAANLTIDAQQNSRIFDVIAGGIDLTVAGLTLTGGKTGSGEYGGAIRFNSSGTLTIENSELTGNMSGGPGGGVYSNDGTVHLIGVEISDNTASGSGGAILSSSGPVSVVASTITRNSGGNGGGIFTNSSAISVTGSTVSENQAITSGGGIFTNSGPVTVTNSTISDNTTEDDGGGIYTNSGDVTITNSTISGNETTGAFCFCSNDGGGIFALHAVVNVIGSTVSGNTSEDSGGGIFAAYQSLSVTDSTISANSADGQGGGIRSREGIVSITRSVISDNASNGTVAGRGGGGVFALHGSIEIADSTLSGNSADLDGGGIKVTSATVSVSNSTISGNSAASGGGIQTYSGSVSIRNTTITENSADSRGGGVYVSDAPGLAAHLTIVSSIIAGNTAGELGADFVRDPGDMPTVTDSLIGDNSGTGLAAGAPDGDGNLVGAAGSLINPRLAALEDNYGTTPAHAPTTCSPAIDAGSNPDGLITDQRGLARTFGGATDIGASELDYVVTAACADETLGLVIKGTEADDKFTLMMNAPNLRIHNANHALIAGVGAIPIDGNTVEVPLANIARGEVFLNALGGDDTLIIDFSGGDFGGPLTHIRFDGGQNTGPPGDTLVLQGGGPFAAAEYNFTNSSDGSIDVTGNATISYTGLEPINSSIDAADVTLNYSTAAETITVSDASIAGTGELTFVGLEVDGLNGVGGLRGASATAISPDGSHVYAAGHSDDSVVVFGRDVEIPQTMVSSTAGETVTFNNPTGTLTINGGDTGDDVIEIMSLAANYRANLKIDGQGGVDVIHVQGPITTDNNDIDLSAETVNTTDRLDVGAGSIAITTDSISIGAAMSGTGTLTISPQSAGTTIGIGGGTGALNVDDSEIARLADGFSSITIGDSANGTGGIEIDTATFLDPVVISGGTINDNAGTDLTAPSATLDGNVSPGQSPGVLSVVGDFSFADGDTFTVEIGGTTPGDSATNHDQLNVTGTVTIGNGVTLTTSAFGGFALVGGEALVIIDSTDGILGTFNGLDEGGTIPNFIGSDLDAVITYEGGTDGNDVVLTVKFSTTIDRTAPTPVITATQASPTNADPINVSVDFGEVVNDFVLDDVSVTSGTASNFVTADNQTFTFEVSPAADGAVTIDIAAAVATDDAGNDNLAATQFSITSDRTAPTPVITATQANPTDADPINVSVDFGEAVNGFVLDDVSVTNGTAGNFVTADNQTFTFDVSPAADGAVEIDIVAGVATDDAGNNNLAATQFSITSDRTAPTPIITATQTSPTGADPINVSVDFGEVVNDFVLDDLSVTNGTASNFVTADNRTFSFDVSPAADGAVTIDIVANVATDEAGNNNLAATQFSITSDQTAPTPVITATQASPTDADPISVRVDFGEVVNDFVLNDVSVINGMAGNFATADNQTFTFDVSPATEGAVTIDIAAAVATDNAGNNNSAATRFSITSQTCTTVSHGGDNGLGSLRYAIDCSNQTPGLQTIGFNFDGPGPHTIRPQSALPSITDPVVIDATIQPGYSGTPLIEIDGSSAGDGVSGITIANGGGGSTIRGLAINRFGASGIFVSRRDSVSIEGNYLGTDPSGTVGLGNGEAGVHILNGENNTVFDNLIAGNEMGVVVEGPLSAGNVLQKNRIGLSATGELLKNRLVNVDIAGAPDNTIGGPVGLGNVLVGSKVGIHIRGSAATGNVVQGNAIGNDLDGTAILNNRGIEIKTSATGNTIGGAGDAGNVISGNTKGVVLNSVEGNLVHGNKIGTNAAGDAALPNVRGVLVVGGANNQIGEEPNLISGNTRDGVRILGEAATGNVIRGNYIGTSADGAVAIPNRDGVLISPGAEGNTIGGTTAAERNIISGNHRAGVLLQADNNSVVGNFIGTDAAGTEAAGNETGVLILRSTGNTIGGPVGSGAGNAISGNREEGVRITGDGASENAINGNFIGTDPAGMAAVGNAHGVVIESGGNNVGGATASDGNVISGNRQNGVYLVGAAATGNLIRSNRIGMNIDGTAALANARSGVLIEDAPGNAVGGPGIGNAIGGNTQQGIRITGAGSTGNLVQGNSIGFDGLTMTAIANGDGVRIADDASGNQIGGAMAGEDNEIAHNTGRGIWISGGTGNRITQNSIHDNGSIGISLGAQGATPNDPDTGSGADADSGANRLQNFPEIASAFDNGGNLEITYSVPSVTPNSAFPINVEFFVADGSGEGETFIGADSYTAPGEKFFSFTPLVKSTGPVVATATDLDGNTSEFSAPVSIAIALRAAGGEVSPESRVEGRELTAADLQPIVGVAVERFVAVGFASELFDNVEVAVADLPGAALGLAMGNTIAIDVNAAGHGWFVDITPLDDAEFANPQSAIRNPQSIDLLTVVMHELGHVAGLPDLDEPAAEDDLMFGWLEAGARKSPLEASLADQAFVEL